MKKFLCLFLISLLSLSSVGCGNLTDEEIGKNLAQGNENNEQLETKEKSEVEVIQDKKNDVNYVKKSSVSTKDVSQNSEYDYATFEFQLPKDWICGPKYEFSVIACPQSATTKEFKDEIEELPFLLGIDNYYYNGLAMNKDNKDIYDDLFNGKTDTYEKQLNQAVFNSMNLDLGNPEGFLDYIDLLIPEENNVQNSSQYIKDFECKHYKGTYGKITEVQYTINYDDTDIRTIECYREDIPYVVTGTISDKLELSSGDIAIWIADSLKVKEHFTFKDGVFEKES